MFFEKVYIFLKAYIFFVRPLLVHRTHPFSTTLLKMARFQFHLQAGFGFTRGSFGGRFSVFFLLCPRVAGEISSSLKYNIDIFAFIHTIFTLHVQRDIIISECVQHRSIVYQHRSMVNLRNILIVTITSKWHGPLSFFLYVMMVNNEKLGTISAVA